MMDHPSGGMQGLNKVSNGGGGRTAASSLFVVLYRGALCDGRQNNDEWPLAAP